jgi:hypothetical protein
MKKIQNDLELEILQPTKMTFAPKVSKRKRKKWGQIMQQVKF